MGQAETGTKRNKGQADKKCFSNKHCKENTFSKLNHVNLFYHDLKNTFLKLEFIIMWVLFETQVIKYTDLLFEHRLVTW